jgi:teichuronic acid biosynthesis glycosyltransferase TuaC
MASPLNVLLVTNLFPTPADPTRGIFTFQLASRLRSLCNLTVVCPLPWFPAWANTGLIKKWGEFSRIPRMYEHRGFIVYSPKYLMIPKMSEAVHAALMFPSLYQAVKRLNRENRFDVVNTQWLYPDGVAAALATRRLGLPHVVTALGCDANLFLKQRHKRPQIAWALRKAHGITVVSDALRKFLIEEGFGDKRIDVIPNGVDARLFFPRNKVDCREKLGIPEDGKMVLFVGQLLEVKGVIYLIEAVDRLLATRKDFCVYCVGEGADRQTYEGEIIRRGMADRIHLIGNRPHPEVAIWMGAADVFCLPSVREGFPNVVLEALFSGRPVVASRVGGVPEMVNDRNGITILPRNSNALKGGLECAMNRKWSEKDITNSVEKLSWDYAAESYYRAFCRAAKRC